MNTLYIHGLGSFPMPEKLNLLKKHGFTPFALHLDYENETGVYSKLRSYALEKEVQFIVGSSLGGMLGYWLGEELGLPVLLFNPALQHPLVPLAEPEVYKKSCPLRLVVLGDHDKVVEPLRTFAFLEKQNRNNTIQKVLRCSWLEHKISLDVFDEMLAWAVVNLHERKHPEHT